MNNTNQEIHNDEISLKEIWDKIWINKVLIVLITTLTVVLGTVVLYTLNKSGTSIQNNFNYDFVTVDINAIDREPYYYADGTTFNFRETINYNFLESVKASNPLFSDVDVEKLSRSLKFNVTKIEIKNKNDEVLKTHLQIELPTSVFKNNLDTAKLFTNEIHNKIILEARERNQSLSIYNNLKENNELLDDLSYDDIFDIFQTQYSTLNNDITNLISKYGDLQVKNQDSVYYGKNLSNVKSDNNLWYTNTVRLNQLRALANQEGYLNNVDANIEDLKLEREYLEQQLDLKEKSRDALVDVYNQIKDGASINESNDFYKRIASLTEEIVSLEKRLFDLNKILTFHNENDPKDDQVFIDEDAKFNANVKRLITQLIDRTDYYNEIKIDFLNQVTKYTQYEHKQFQVVKPYNMILMVVVLGMVGGVIGVTVALIKESGKKKEIQ